MNLHHRPVNARVALILLVVLIAVNMIPAVTFAEAAAQVEQQIRMEPYVVTQNANLYATPDAAGKLVRLIFKDKTVYVTDSLVDASGLVWYAVQYENEIGYMAAENLEKLSAEGAADRPQLEILKSIVPQSKSTAPQAPVTRTYGKPLGLEEVEQDTPAPTVAPGIVPLSSASPEPTPMPTDALPEALAALIEADATKKPNEESSTEPEPLATVSAAYASRPSGYEPIAMTSLGNADGSVFIEGNTLAPYYTDYHFPSIRTMQGIFSTVGMYVSPPKYCDIQSATLLVSYTCSDLILSDYSSLTFYMNGVPFYSCPVIRYSGRDTMLYVTVPLNLFQEQYNLLEIRGYVRLTEDEGCTDEYNGANWINFHEATCLRLGYDLAEHHALLSMYPYPFVSLQDETGGHFSVAVSDQADEKELEAALLTMADMGKEVPEVNDITLTRYGNNQNPKVLYFGLVKNTPEELLALIDTPIPEDGVILKRISEPDRELLLVIAHEGEALVDAARLLADDSRIAQIETTEHVLALGETAVLMQNMQLSGMVADGLWTIKEFIGGGIPFYGPFRQETVINLPVPKDYALGADGKFTLNMRYSENLNFDRSLMTVYWNTTPLASKKLTAEGAEGDTLIVNVPADLVGMNGSSITIAFDLEVKDLVCTPRQMNMPWAYITEDSTVYLPLGSSGEYNLSYLPAPFQLDGSLNDLLIIIADNPTAQELVALGRVLSMLGNSSNAYGSLRVIHASDFSASDADYNIIAVGQPLQNTFLQQINEYLYFTYMPNFTAFMSNTKLILSENYATQIGTIQLLHSPYADTRALLAVTGVSDIGMRQLTRLVSTDEMRWSLTNDTLIIDQNSKVTTYQSYFADKSQSSRPSVVDMIVQQREPLIFTLVATSAMLVLLIGAVMVLIRIHMRKKKD